MKNALVTIMVLASCAAVAPARALDAGDTMQAWKRASGDERAALLKKLDAAGDGVARCLDEAANAPGHSSLPIAEVAKACAIKDGQPV